jgi:hypothetical protein
MACDTISDHDSSRVPVITISVVWSPARLIGTSPDLATAFRYAASLPTGRDLTELDQLKRRSFITLRGGAAAWPLTARAQQGERMRRIGVLTGGAANDPVPQAFIAIFLQSLEQLGWTDGRNVRIDTRWAAGSAADARRYAAAPTASDIEGPTDFDRVDICFEAEISRGALDSRMAQERPNRL